MTNQMITINDELYAAICEAYSIIEKVFDLKCEEESLKSKASEQLNIAQAQIRKKQKRHFTLPLLAMLLTIPITSFLTFTVLLLNEINGIKELSNMLSFLQGALAFFNDGNYTKTLLMALIYGLIAFAISFIIPCKNKMNLKAAAEYEHQADEIAHSIDMMIFNNVQCLSIVAPEYRYPIATKELLSILRLGRATTLPVAYDKLELRLHQMKVEEGLATMISLQKDQLDALERK